MSYNREKKLLYTYNTLIPTAAYSATAVSLPDAGCKSYDDAIIYVDIVTVGTATLQVNYQTSPDGGTTWYTQGQSAVLNANGLTTFNVKRPCGLLFRLQAVYGGSGNITYAVAVEFSKDG